MSNVKPISSNQTDTLEHGQNALRHAADVLNTLADKLDDSFIQAVDALYNCQGRVVVSGMGKSGHIGNKIAATLASTGTPAFFVHPGEASHGDLGMVTSEDVVIAISHSGGTKELSDMIAHCARLNVVLIAITGKAESDLGRAATLVLNNHVTKESDPINMAPTNSTTASLALGDALAVALMQRRGFQPQDFAAFHPGGKLGANLKTVAELMITGSAMPLISDEARMDDALLLMSDKKLGCVGVTDTAGKLVGMVTDGDLRRHMSGHLLQQPVTAVMTENPITTNTEQLAPAALALLQDKQITAVFVVDDQQQPVGLLHIHHLLQAGVV